MGSLSNNELKEVFILVDFCMDMKYIRTATKLMITKYATTGDIMITFP